MSENGLGGEWFEGLPRTGRIYQLIERSQVSERRETRIRALRALGESEDPRAVYPLVECTNDDAADIRRYATEGLFRLRSVRGVEALHDRLKDGKEVWITRRLAADALGEIRSQRAIEILVQCLQDREEDPSLREYVAMVLARTRSEIARQALMQCCSEESTAVGKAAGEALHTFDTNPTFVEEMNWPIQNTFIESHQVKEGVAFRR
jgi:HEAT repeat protein